MKGQYPYQHAKDERIRDLLHPLTQETAYDLKRPSSKLRYDIIKEMDQKKENEYQKQKEIKLKAIEEEEFIEELHDPTPKYIKQDFKIEKMQQGKNKLRPTSFEIMKPLGAGAFGQVWLVK